MSNPSDVQRVAAMHQPIAVCEYCGPVDYDEVDGPGPGERMHMGGRAVIINGVRIDRQPALIQCFGSITLAPRKFTVAK